MSEHTGSEHTGSEQTASPRTPIVKVVAASMAGTTVEWYDYFLYGVAAAVVFPHVFFPAEDPTTGTMLSLGTFAVGFIARPIGGLVFGHFGDIIGRKKLLVVSLLMMGGATFLIGLLPSYASIGIAAPALLVLLRLIQGFALGGEWGGAVLIVSEHGKPSTRGYWASWPQAGAPAGQLLANGLLAVLAVVQPEDAFLSWGWRIPFLLSAVLVGIASTFGWPSRNHLSSVRPSRRPHARPPRANRNRCRSSRSSGATRGRSSPRWAPASRRTCRTTSSPSWC